MKSIKKIFILIFSLFVLGSCTSTKYMSISALDENYESIDVYMAGIQSPIRDYSIIAYVETTGSVFTTKEQLIKSLKRKTEKLKGDAIIEVDFSYRAWALSSLPTIDGFIVKYK